MLRSQPPHPSVLAEGESGPWCGVPAQECVRLMAMLLRCWVGATVPGQVDEACTRALADAVSAGRFARVDADRDAEGRRLAACAENVLLGSADSLTTEELAGLYRRCIPPAVKLPCVVILPGSGVRAAWFVPDRWNHRRWTSCIAVQPTLAVAASDLAARGALLPTASAADVNHEVRRLYNLVALIMAQNARRGCEDPLRPADRRMLRQGITDLVTRLAEAQEDRKRAAPRCVDDEYGLRESGWW